MKVELGDKGLDKTFQSKFPKTVECPRCKQTSKIAFVAHEMDNEESFVYQLYGGAWLHDACAVAVYICPKCMCGTAEWNQA